VKRDAALLIDADERFSEGQGVLSFGNNPKRRLYPKKPLAPRNAQDEVSELLSSLCNGP
jgi:hypothetical protein